MTFRLLLLSSVLLVACKTDALRGQVVDIWGNPIEGATVKMEGQTERPMTDSNGWFPLPKVTGTHTVKAGRQGYIEDVLQVTIGEGEQSSPVIHLYPEPEEKGFYIVGSQGYQSLQPQPIQAIGSEIKALYGLKNLGDASVDGNSLRIIYHTDLRLAQVMTLEPVLHKMAFQRDAELQGALTTSARINLWTSEEKLETKLDPMKSKSDYLIQVEGPLEPGAYALTTHNLLTPADTESFRMIAKPLRIAFPFELR